MSAVLSPDLRRCRSIRIGCLLGGRSVLHCHCDSEPCLHVHKCAMFVASEAPLFGVPISDRHFRHTWCADGRRSVREHARWRHLIRQACHELPFRNFDSLMTTISCCQEAALVDFMHEISRGSVSRNGQSAGCAATGVVSPCCFAEALVDA